MIFNFDKALDQTRSSDRITEMKDFYGVNTNEELDRINKAFRDRVETKKINFDMSQVKYRKNGTNEYKAARYINDPTKVLPIGTEKLGNELIKGEISNEIQPPYAIEDDYGNVFIRI